MIGNSFTGGGQASLDVGRTGRGRSMYGILHAAPYCDNTVPMRRQTVITKKRKGPLPTGKGTLVGVRLQPKALSAVDSWAASQDDKPSRPEAIRRLLEQALSLPRK